MRFSASFYLSGQTREKNSLSIYGKSRGCHLITSEIQNALDKLETLATGLAHTSASLSINENANPDVRSDMEQILNHLVPDDEPYYEHTLQGSDDMPAHEKSSLLEVSRSIVITVVGE
jgi:secondary thiamine-phosphate synthase enzyme